MNKEIPEEIMSLCSKKVLFARARLLQKNGFYGLLLMHMRFSLSYECEKATANNDYLVFSPEFLMKLEDTELEYVLMHLVTHVALQHYSRAEGLNRKLFFKACDIVVNSNILKSKNMDLNSISIQSEGGVQPHLAPDGSEGHLHSAQEIYEMLLMKEYDSTDESEDDSEEKSDGSSNDIEDGDSQSTGGTDNTRGHGWDNHTSEISGIEDVDYIEDEWKHRIREASEKTERRNSIMKLEGSRSCGHVPAFFERILQQMRNPLINWRIVLNEFIQEEIMDYSFSPPDRRYDDSPFYLPDFNEKDERVKDILFMVDTSSSMKDEVISDCYYEIKGAIDQYDGKLEGWLGFFDADVKEPKPFSDITEFMIIRPEGGGETSFQCIFDCVNHHKDEIEPTCIVILTDGYAEFPDETVSNEIPVLWIIYSSDVIPPWGKCVVIK